MSETPYSSGDSDPTQRFEPGAPTPVPPSAPDLTKRPSASPAAPGFSTPPQSGPPADYYPASTPGHLAYGPAASAGQPGYPQQPYPQQSYPQQPYGQQPAYPGYPGYPQQGYGAPQYDAYGRPLSDKSKVVAGVLGIALGGFGAGRFYTGHTSIAVAQLIVTLVTCGLGHFWGLIDGIMTLVNGGTDAEGRVLRD